MTNKEQKQYSVLRKEFLEILIRHPEVRPNVILAVLTNITVNTAIIMGGKEKAAEVISRCTNIILSHAK